MSDCQSCGHCLGGTFCYFPQEDVHGNHVAQWRTGGCPACAERNAIVAWLREEQARLEGIANKQSAYMRDEFTDGQAYWSDMAADAIENGEHLRGDDE